MEHIKPSDQEKIVLYNRILANKNAIIPYRNSTLFELSEIRQITKEVWPLKTFNNLERPVYILIALQTGRRGSKTQYSTTLDTAR